MERNKWDKACRFRFRCFNDFSGPWCKRALPTYLDFGQGSDQGRQMKEEAWTLDSGLFGLYLKSTLPRREEEYWDRKQVEAGQQTYFLGVQNKQCLPFACRTDIKEPRCKKLQAQHIKRGDLLWYDERFNKCIDLGLWSTLIPFTRLLKAFEDSVFSSGQCFSNYRVSQNHRERSSKPQFLGSPQSFWFIDLGWGTRNVLFLISQCDCWPKDHTLRTASLSWLASLPLNSCGSAPSREHYWRTQGVKVLPLHLKLRQLCDTIHFPDDPHRIRLCLNLCRFHVQDSFPYPELFPLLSIRFLFSEPHASSKPSWFSFWETYP